MYTVLANPIHNHAVTAQALTEVWEPITFTVSEVAIITRQVQIRSSLQR